MSQNRHKGIVSQLSASRTALLEALAGAVIIAVAAGALASLLASTVNGWVTVAAAVALLLVGVLILGRHLFWLSERESMDAMFVLSRTTGAPHEVVNYRFAEKFAQVLHACTVENAALKAQWEAEDRFWSFGAPDEAFDEWYSRTVRGNASRLVWEVAEYIFLDALSTHLVDHPYLRDSGAQAQTLRREDLSDVVLRNRVLELLSRPMVDRHGFEAHSSGQGRGEVVLASGSDGRMYSRFDLTLPKGSRVHRQSNGSFLIRTPYVDVEFGVTFVGMSAPFEPTMATYLLTSPHDWNDLAAFNVTLTWCSSVRMKGLMRRSGWELHQWVESFSDEASQRLGWEGFLESIDWEQTRVLLRALEA